MTQSPDVIVIGGGIIGLSIAREAALSGLSTHLIEQGEPGCGSSSAAAGMLMPHIENIRSSPLQPLALESRRLYGEFTDRVMRESGLDPHLLNEGSVLLARSDEGDAAIDTRASHLRESGLRVERLTPEDLARLEPGLAAGLTGGLLLSDDASVDNVILVRALHRAALRAGARIESGVRVRRLHTDHGRIVGVESDSGRCPAGAVVVAAGAWSGNLHAEEMPTPPTHPVRGQIVCLQPDTSPIRRIISVGPIYLVRRHDGRILIGSTMERVGFDTTTTAEGIATLLRDGLALVPALRRATLHSAWAGLRPATEDGLPAIGPGALPGLLYATGHLRHGILLAPITARLIVRLLRGENIGWDLSPFDPCRLVSTPAG